jgi:hypothetical protein
MPELNEIRFEAEWSTSEDIEAQQTGAYRKTLKGALSLIHRYDINRPDAGLVYEQRWDGREWAEVARYNCYGEKFNPDPWS